MYRAGFATDDKKVKFEGNKDVNEVAGGEVIRKSGLTYEQAAEWFSAIWDSVGDDPYFEEYKKKNKGQGVG